MNLQSSIVELKGIGAKSAEKFYKLDIYTIEDLLLYYPFRYEDFKSKRVSELADGEKAGSNFQNAAPPKFPLAPSKLIENLPYK